MIIYKLTDRVKIKIRELVFTLAPLDYFQKRKIQDMAIKEQFENAVIYAIKCSLKDIEGLETSDSNKYELEFEDGIVSDKCIAEFLGSIPNSDLLQAACTQMATKILSEESLPGIKIIKDKEIKKKVKS